MPATGIARYEPITVVGLGWEYFAFTVRFSPWPLFNSVQDPTTDSVLGFQFAASLGYPHLNK